MSDNIEDLWCRLSQRDIDLLHPLAKDFLDTMSDVLPPPQRVEWIALELRMRIYTSRHCRREGPE
jgi:hypothetical protein